MDTSSSARYADQLSVVHLSHIHEGVLQLREHLRSALLDDSPQTEMIVYTRLYQLYRDFYLPFFVAKLHIPSQLPPGAGSAPSPDARPAASAEARFVMTTYTQDVLAACVYLLDPASLPATYIVTSTPPACEEAQNEANASSVYISAEQRRFCGRVFLYMCWASAALPLHIVLQALYPLLDPGVSGAPRATTTTLSTTADPPRERQGPSLTENHIAADLFSQERFACQKRLLRDTLNGLVLTRANGVRALLRVLLLNDRVTTEMTGEAAQLLVQLLTSPVFTLWQQQQPQQLGESLGYRSPFSAAGEEECAAEVVVTHVTTALSVEDQVRLLAPQLLALLEEHADATLAVSSASRTAARPRFLARLDAARLRLPAETLEQRLHLALTMLLNALVRLPPRDKHDFARSYRQLFYTNKFVLSPGFGCLSLRSDTDVVEDDAIAALLRLGSLIKGVSSGAGSGVMAHVLPATAAGLLNICAVLARSCDGDGNAAQFVSPSLPATLRSLFSELLSSPSLYDLCARALVNACGEARAHCYLPGNAAQPRLRYTRDVCGRERLVTGLQWLLLDVAATTPDFVHTCVDVMVEACHLELFAAGVENLTVSPAPRLTETKLLVSAPTTENDTSPLIALLERLSLEATPEALFGSRGASLASTLELLGRMLALSGALYRWALGLVEHLLAASSVEVHLGGGDTRAERWQNLSRLQRCSRKILASLTQLNTPTPRGGAWHSVVSTDGAQLSLTARVQQALGAFLERIEEHLASCEAVEQLSYDKQHRQGEAITAVRAEWEQLAEKLRAALDSRAAIDVAVTLAKLAHGVDDVVFEVTDPQPLYDTTQRLLQLLVRVLCEADDVGAAVRAVHCVAWLGMYRFDSKDSTYMADVMWSVLAEDHLPPWLSASAEYTVATQAAAASRICRLRVRVLDVLLSWTDYDEDDLTLRNLDDSLRRKHHTSLYDVLVALCRSTEDAFVQVAALHFIGTYALAMQPRVPVSAICDLCRDVFRLSRHEMAKAACAAALGKIVASLCHPSDATLLVLSELDINNLQTLASAMSSYRGRPHVEGNTSVTAPAMSAAAETDLHDEVIRLHGREMLAILRRTSLGFGGARAGAAPAAADDLRVSSLRVSELRRA
ncbi:hypothetical protein, conserved [Leishmania donovani]|uniref:Uncharacterized protein n=1 Tax=Leishmania donovani TaxID=5661 RepID=E9BI37_LEIDO|nr:hypothetical protein, conserved [Leishmania donovani]CBZ34913.1 hypothetical protein, conserved [Leishmania donovani]